MAVNKWCVLLANESPLIVWDAARTSIVTMSEPAAEDLGLTTASDAFVFDEVRKAWAVRFDVIAAVGIGYLLALTQDSGRGLDVMPAMMDLATLNKVIAFAKIDYGSGSPYIKDPAQSTIDQLCTWVRDGTPLTEPMETFAGPDLNALLLDFYDIRNLPELRLFLQKAEFLDYQRLLDVLCVCIASHLVGCTDNEQLRQMFGASSARLYADDYAKACKELTWTRSSKAVDQYDDHDTW